MKETLQGHDPITGKGIDIDASRVIVPTTDPKARIMAIAGLGLGSLGLAVGGYAAVREPTVQVDDDFNIAVEEDIRQDVEALKALGRVNMIGDCKVENEQRRVREVEQISFEECVDERFRWMEELDSENPGEVEFQPVPAPTRAPSIPQSRENEG